MQYTRVAFTLVLDTKIHVMLSMLLYNVDRQKYVDVFRLLIHMLQSIRISTNSIGTACSTTKTTLVLCNYVAHSLVRIRDR